MPGKPVVYVETNWIVSLCYTFRERHLAAKSLLAQAEAQQIDLRIPYGCLLEAVHAIESAGQDAMTAINRAKDMLKFASDAAEPNTSQAVAALVPATGFLAKEPRPFLAALEANAAVSRIHDVEKEMPVLDDVRGRVRFRGKDKFDLYVIAAIVANRRELANDVPVVFCSENKTEFEPKAAGPAFTAYARVPSEKRGSLPSMPATFYEEHRLVWCSDYKLPTAIGLWNAKFPPPA